MNADLALKQNIFQQARRSRKRKHYNQLDTKPSKMQKLAIRFIRLSNQSIKKNISGNQSI
jgi:hypothetical protein